MTDDAIDGEGIRLLRREMREERIATSYRSAYAKQPLNDDEARMLDAALVLALGLDG